MPKTLTALNRVNISIEEELHAAAKRRAKELRLPGGFSELIARLLNKNIAGKGRDVLKSPRFYSQKRDTTKAIPRPAPAPSSRTRSAAVDGR